MAKLQHHLISVPIRGGGYMHTYLMCNDKKFIMHATDRMINEAEKMNFEVWPPVVLSTDLSKGGFEIVRDFIRSRFPENVLEIATDYHVTMWAMSEADPDHSRLMDLH